MTLLSNWDNNSIPLYSGRAYSDCWGWAGGGREYAFIGSTQGTYCIDITVPTAPVEVDFKAGPSSICGWREYKTYNNHLFMSEDGTGTGKFQIFDLSYLPDSMHKVYESNAFFSTCHMFFINPNNGRLYACGTNTMNPGVLVLNVTNPSSPTLLGSYNLGGYVHDCYVVNDTLYAFQGFAQLGIFDFTNLLSPGVLNIITSYPDQGYGHSGWIDPAHNYLVIADETHGMRVKIGSISPTSTITWLSFMDSDLLAPTHTNSIGHNPYFKGNLCIISWYHDGVQIFDWSNPSSPVRVGYYDTYSNTDYAGFKGCWGVYPFLPSGNIIASDMSNGLFVLSYNPPPLGLLDFSAHSEKNKVDLEWNLSSEINTDFYSIEKSLDAENFSAFGQVDGIGNSGGPVSYEYSDDNPTEGISYYRIRLVDLNGGVTYSNTVLISYERPKNSLEIFPVPTGGAYELTVNFFSPDGKDISVSCFDVRGKTVCQKIAPAVQGLNSIYLDIRDMDAGVYALKISGVDISLAGKFIITQ